jgi:hypothetical protein
MNALCLGGNCVVWYFTRLLIDAGWTVRMSGSGVGGVYNSSGDCFVDNTTNPVTGSNVTDIGGGYSNAQHFGNAKCWIVMSSPGGCELCFWRGTTGSDSGDGVWTIAHAYTPYTMIGGDEETAPLTSTGVVSIDGSLTVPNANIFHPGSEIGIAQMAADDTPSLAGAYGAFLLSLEGGNALGAVLGIDDVRNCPVTADYPQMIIYSNTSSGLTAAGVRATSLFGYNNFSLSAETFDNIIGPGGYYLPATAAYPGEGGISNWDGKEWAMPIPVGFGADGYIGTSRWLSWPAVTRGYPNTSNSKVNVFVSEVLIKELGDGTTEFLSV